MTASRLAFFLFVLTTANAVAGRDAAGNVVQQFYRAWAAGDAASAAKLWAPEARSGVEARLRRRAVARCTVLHALRIDSIDVDPSGTEAVVAVTLWTTSWSTFGQRRAIAEERRTHLRLKQIGGEWRIASETDREERWIDELLAAGDAAVRQEMLHQHSAMGSPRLARALASRSITLINRDDFARAREAMDASMVIAEAVGDDGALSLALGARSALERQLRPMDLRPSEAYGREAVAAAERAGDPDVLAYALLRLGRAVAAAGGDEAPLWKRILDMADHIEDATVLTMAATQSSRHHEYYRDFRQALILAATSARYAEESGSATAALTAATNLGNLHRNIGDFQLAAPYLERAVAVADASRFPTLYSSAVANLVEVYRRLQEPQDKLLPMIAMALDRTQDRVVLADLHAIRAGMRMDAGDFEGAEADVAESKCHTTAVDPDHVALHGFSVEAALRNAQGRFADAIAAAPFIHGAREQNFDSLRGLGRTDEAIAIAEALIESQDYDWTRLGDGFRQRQTYLDERREVYRQLAEMLVARGDVEAALDVAERSKARLLLEIVGRGAPKRESDLAERRTVETIEALNRRRLAEPAARSAIDADLARARLELSEIQTRRDLHEQRLGLSGFAPVQPPPGAVALEYLTGVTSTVIFTMTGTAGGKPDIRAKVVPIGRRALEADVKQLRERIAARDLRFDEPAARLYDALIAPVEEIAFSGGAICIVPDDVLWTVPFGVLKPARGKRLIERAAVFYVPSLRVAASLRRNDAAERPAQLLAFGNPRSDGASPARLLAPAAFRALSTGDLPEAETEVRAIGRIYGEHRASVFVREDARETTFKSRAEAADLIHLATHGVVDDQFPMFSAIVLAHARGDPDDGLLEAHEIAEMRLKARLVILSACDTALGRTGGEGLLGLSWAMFSAGAEVVVGAQWKADSHVASLLMTAFHQNLSRGLAPHQALRQAQLALRADPRYAHPFDWAPFVTVGSP